MSEKQYWGKYGEYGPFSAQTDGWPNRGEVLRTWRKTRKMTARYIAEEYGKRVHGEPVSERWITMAERYNTIPKDEQRRRILAAIVGIPPLLFGLGNLEELQLQETTMQPTKEATVTTTVNALIPGASIQHYDKFLQLYWQIDYTSTAQHSLPDIEEMIRDLHGLLPQVKSNEQMTIYELLCGFYPLASTIYNDIHRHTEAFHYADQSVILADNMNNNKMRAVAWYQRGFISLQQGTLQSDQINPTSVNAAINDFERALPLAIPRLAAAILLDLAYAQALLKQRRVATTHLDTSGKIMSKGRLEDGTFVDLFANLDRGRYHLGRAVTLMTLKEYDEAEEELDLADELIPPDQTRRHAWINILRAKVYVQQGTYPLAAEMALNALSVCKGIHSLNNIKLIRDIHTQLGKSSYKHAQPVSKLGAALVLP